MNNKKFNLFFTLININKNIYLSNKIYISIKYVFIFYIKNNILKKYINYILYK